MISNLFSKCQSSMMEIKKELSRHESNSQLAIIMELSCEESCCSAGNNQAAEQAGITQHSWQLSSRWQAGIVQLSWQLSSRWADTNHAAQQARITWLSMHCSRGWSYTDHVIDHALITWISCTDHVADHTPVTWHNMHRSRGTHALITWLLIPVTSSVSQSSHLFFARSWAPVPPPRTDWISLPLCRNPASPLVVSPPPVWAVPCSP